MMSARRQNRLFLLVMVVAVGALLIRALGERDWKQATINAIAMIAFAQTLTDARLPRLLLTAAATVCVAIGGVVYWREGSHVAVIGTVVVLVVVLVAGMLHTWRTRNSDSAAASVTDRTT